MQAACYASAKLLEGDIREATDKEVRARLASALGQLGRNWTSLAESIRILKGQPTPGSLRPEQSRPKRERPIQPSAPEMTMTPTASDERVSFGY